MKKKVNAWIMAGVLAASSFAALPVFAEETVAETPVAVEETAEETTEETEAVETTEAETTETETTETTETEVVEAAELQYGLQIGFIETIENNNDGSWRIVVNTANGGLVCNLASKVKVFNAIEGGMVNMDTLDVVDEVAVVLKANTPMTMSLPPQVSQVEAFVVLEAAGAVKIDQFDENLTSSDNNLQLNIDEKNTVILDLQGSRRLYTAEDLKNQELVVCYTVSTKSIPAQTTPSMVVVLGAAEAGDTKTVEEPETVALREVAEAAGYTVGWTSNEEPIVLTNADATKTITIVLDSAEVTIAEGETTNTVTMTAAATLVDGVTMVPADFAAQL